MIIVAALYGLLYVECTAVSAVYHQSNVGSGTLVTGQILLNLSIGYSGRMKGLTRVSGHSECS